MFGFQYPMNGVMQTELTCVKKWFILTNSWLVLTHGPVSSRRPYQMNKRFSLSLGEVDRWQIFDEDLMTVFAWTSSVTSITACH